MRRTFALVTGVLTCALLAACDGGDVSYRPPVAATFDRADCQAPDIERRLTALVDDGIDTGPPAQGVGYPPADFVPVSVVRCERGENSSGALTIDSVRLEGDIGAAWDAFREESERFPEGAMASCIRQTPSVAVWFVDDEERAVRPAWPSTGCGPKDGPIAALAKLREVDRQQHVTALRADDPGVCDTKFGKAFSTTTDADVRPDSEEERRARISEKSALAFPIDGIGRLQVCRYRETGGESTQESRSRLTVQQSADVVLGVVAAPAASACSLVATRTATIALLRPDGSGGDRIDVELDGCTRATASGLLRQVVVPASVLEVIDAGTQ